MRIMRCPDCRRLISWVPRPNGHRVPILTEQDPRGEWFLDADGVLQEWHEMVAPDVPRYVIHLECSG